MAAPPQRHTDRAQRAERDATIFRLRIAGWTERRIAAHVKISPARVHGIIADAIRDLVEPEVEELRKLTAARLDDQRAVASTVRARPHYVVQGGKIVRDEHGNPLIDDGPVLAANDQLRKIDETEIRLYGLAAKEPLEIVLERRTEEEAKAVMTAVEGVFTVLGLDAKRRLLALEAAGCALEGAPLPEPPPVEETTTGNTVPWPVTLEGREHVWIRGAYHEVGPKYAPREPEVFDAEVVDDDLTGDQDAPGPGAPDNDPVAVRRELEAAKAEFPDLPWSGDE
ncbi:hypothetical protein [Streptomyces olivochromogenes]|uniref:hypothetical protein n=1 Tax=Streptomyces olivochromogenes TaxID=1963 RepID=UPI0036A130DB